MRWAAFLMGAWVAGSLIVSVVATENFYTIDRLLAARPNDAFRDAVDRIGQPQSRDLLRYLSSELNRLYFQLWNGAQVVIGLGVLWLIARAPDARRIRIIVGGLLASVLLMLLWLAPEITAVGRGLDFVPRDPAPAALGRFGVLHATYATLEVGKMAAGILAAAWMIRASRRQNEQACA